MSKSVKLIYDLIIKDLKVRGWDDVAIAEAIAECQRERQVTGADDKTICVKEMSHLSQESLQKVAMQMDKTEANIFVPIWNWIVNLAKDFWHLNWEAKIGIVLLIPPLLGVVVFVLNMFGAYIDYYEGEYRHEVTPTIPIYLGLMAIAGAYLVKGNLKKKE